MARAARDVILDEIPVGGRFGIFETRPPAEHLVLGVCDLHNALGFVVVSTHDDPFDIGAIAVLAPERLALLVREIARWAARRRRGDKPRYEVCSAGRAGLTALIMDKRHHKIVLRLGGPDRFVVADTIAAVLNASPTEAPVEILP